MQNRSTVLVGVVAMLFLFSGMSLAQEKQETSVFFQVDMTVQILAGNFVEGNDTLDVRGSFNGWTGPIDICSENAFTDNLYETVRTDSFVIDQEEKFKFVITHSGTVIWESQADRPFTVTGEETDITGDEIPDLVNDVVWFSDVSPDDIFTEETVISFEVDMRPAHAYLAENDSITFGGGTVESIESVYIASGIPGTEPEMAWVWDLNPGDPLLTDLELNDAGEGSDRVAGDSIWAIEVTMTPGSPTTFVYKYGIAALDNEAGFGANTEIKLPDYPGFPIIFTEFGQQDTLYTDLWGYPTAINEGLAAVPSKYQLEQNYPNPFNPTTTIEFVLKQQSDISLDVYNMVGQKIRTLINESKDAGVHTVEWNGTNDFGAKVGSGIYFYKLHAGDFVGTKKMVLLK